MEDIGIAPAASHVTHPAFLTSEPLDQVPAASLRDFVNARAVAVGLSGGEAHGVLPGGWITVQPSDLMSAADLRNEFFDFLEAWPARAGGDARSFNDLFTVGNGYSIWWTSVAADRQATRGLVKYFRYASLVDRLFEKWRPATILLFTRDPQFAALVRIRAERAGATIQPLEGSAEPPTDEPVVGRGWLWRSLWRTVGAPFERLRLSMRCARALRGTKLHRRSVRPTLVFASTWPRHFALRDGTFTRIYWEEIGRAIEAAHPPFELAYLPRKLQEVVDTGTTRSGLAALQDVRAPLVIWERYFPVRAILANVVEQISRVCRFYLLARRRAFRESFRFANTDLAPILLPKLTTGVERAIDWSCKSSQVGAALRAAGNVRAVLVSEEMYQPAMPTLAAAKALGIPTIGVQHGTIMPTHFMYALPRGHVEHAPVPDFFGAYGEYGKEVLSTHGAYPPDRVWITGAARLDPLVTQLPDRAGARAVLGLPSGTRIVVLATQTFPWFVSAMRGVLECMRDHPEALLCVKKNPSIHAMPVAQIDAMAEELGVSNIQTFEEHTELLLSACSVWISASSTTLLEATLIGRPTICLNFSGQPDRYPYVEEGVSLPARSIGELKASLARVLGPTEYQGCETRRHAFLNRHLGPTTEGRGAATLARRVADLVANSL